MPGTTTVKVGSMSAKFRARCGNFKRGVLLKLFRAVIEDTPVDTGRLRANWKFTLGSAADTPDAQLDLYDSESKNIPKGGTPVNNVALVSAAVLDANVTGEDQTYCISNSLPYTHRIEYEGWSHEKSPQGMVRKNLVRIAEILRKQAAE